MKNHKYKILLSIVLIVISYGFIIYRITDFIKLHKIPKSFFQINKTDFIILTIVLLLMPLNWFLESVKWSELIKPIEKLNRKKSFKAVLSGITVGIFTPNRIGEIGGRVLFLEKGNRTYGIITTWLGSFSQFIVTISVGIIGSITLFSFSLNSVETDRLFNKTSIISLSTILIFLLWAYFNSHKASKLLVRIPFLKLKEEQLSLLSTTSQKKLLLILVFSLLRYMVFSFQFYLLLLFFNVDISILGGFTSISLIYLCTTLIPTTTLAELGVRGSVAIFIIGAYSSNIPGIIFTSFSLWFINLAIPSLFGSIFLLKNKA